MKQVLQNLKTGAVTVTDVPVPLPRPGFVLVRTAASLISAGTEKSAVEAGQKTLISRAVEQPALVSKVIDRARSEGITKTFDAVRSKLSSSVALGYSAAGTVMGLGEGVAKFRLGDRVACAGLGYASHAEVLSVPQNLCVRLPDEVAFDEAAFATLGAIALQGVRLAEVNLGECVVVIGLGLVGQVTVQLLTANGCRVFGIDLDASKVALAKQSGADDGCIPDNDAIRRVSEWTRGRGADAVVITASTSSNQPVELAGEISRQKGTVVAVGAVGLNIPRQAFYDRELTFRVSKSYGPGRYDPDYEERGRDYPVPYVRWTEGRNLEAFLDLLANGRINVRPLITHRFDVSQTEQAYKLISGNTEPFIGVMLLYDTERELERAINLAPARVATAGGVRLGLIGAGNYAKGILLPLFKSAGVEFQSIATASGFTARDVGAQYGFRSCASSPDEVIESAEVNLIVIATRHATHAQLAQKALEHGKHVFVEKPLALDDEQLERVVAAARSSAGTLMVGFNRRFSPMAIAAKQFFAETRSPLTITYRVNAPPAPPKHWTNDPAEGGGPIRGEVCHFIDFVHFITDSLTSRVYAEAAADGSEVTNEESVAIIARIQGGANAAITYSRGGDRALPKERIEIFGGGKAFIIDDFVTAVAYENGKEKKLGFRKQDKGQANEVKTVFAVVREGKPAPIALRDLAATTRATFAIRESLRTGLPVEVDIQSLF